MEYRDNNYTQTENTHEAPIMVPKTDIIETTNSMILSADMPGVSQDGIEILLDKNVLTISGKTTPKKIENYELVYAEYRAVHYKRSFTISEEFDKSNIEASMKNGVLYLSIPKTPKVEARKIPVAFKE
ncbi:Hsp20/alpha crystallin family protein [bacterium]|nr:Hsp20/alpha crystallin family protein [bacterium]